MKVATMNPDRLVEGERLCDLRCLLDQPSDQIARPCRNCEEPCPCSGSSSCACACGFDCQKRATKMSSDAEKYPIEENIVELVYSFNCLRICPPFWSCEGHQLPDGRVRRVPQVWFYSRSLIYPRLIGELLNQLKFEKVIKHHWHICISPGGDTLDTAFSIEPDVKLITDLDLSCLQTDAYAISRALVSGLRSMAETYLDKYAARTDRA